MFIYMTKDATNMQILLSIRVFKYFDKKYIVIRRTREVVFY